jgi:hypothetical protein
LHQKTFLVEGYLQDMVGHDVVAVGHDVFGVRRIGTSRTLILSSIPSTDGLPSPSPTSRT